MIWISFLLAGCTGTDGETGTTGDDTSAGTGTVTAPPLVVNEFVADNKSEADPDATVLDSGDMGEFDDWIELYNSGTEPVALDGFYLTDDFDVPTKWALPVGVEVAPGAFYLVWADKQPEQGSGNHADFALEENGEAIGLYYAADGGEVWANKVEYGVQATDRSSARIPDGARTWQAGVDPTPGASNG
jgi:hypothetical protein